MMFIKIDFDSFNFIYIQTVILSLKEQKNNWVGSHLPFLLIV